MSVYHPEIKNIVLAALLHDVGKFGQRAGGGRSEEMTSTYCPTNQYGNPGYFHVLYTDYFIERDLPLPDELEGKRSVLAKIASTHHKPEDTLESLSIAIADRLSSGLERMTMEEDWEHFKESRLVPIFSEVSLNDDKGSSEAAKTYDLARLDENPFPSTKENHQGTYTALYEEFINEVSKIPENIPFQHYLGSLASVLENFTWCIPSSSYKTVPDVSLFDHLWTTAALAQALYVYHKEEGGLPSINDKEEKFILFAGDLSGIQNYIFNVEKSHSKGVAKLFRARSFYLQMLTRSVIIEILDRLGLYPVAKVMDAGGKFFLLLPNTERTRKTLDELDGEIQRFFFDKFKGELSLNCLKDFTLTQQDLTLNRFPDVYGELIDQLDTLKLKKFTGIIKSDAFSPVYTLNYNEFEAGNCVVCRRNAATKEMDNDLKLCDDCYKQIQIIGTRLPNREYSYIAFEKGSKGKNTVDLFGGLSMKFYKDAAGVPKDAVEIVNFRGHGMFYHHPTAGYSPTVTSEDISRWENNSELYRDLQEEAEKGILEGMPKTFAMIAQKAQRENKKERSFEGKDFLAAFKADVDNLGLIFSIGLLGKDREESDVLTISRLASLSRMLNHFFSDYLVKFIKEKFQDIYLIFAGGDDLFLIGPWTNVLDFAGELTKEFRRYVAENPDIHLSAGIALAKHRYPIRSLVDVVEGALEKSKSYENGKKNAFTFLGVTGEWGFYPTLLERGKWLDDLVNKEKDAVPIGFVNRLLRYARMRREFLDKEKGRLRAGLYKSLMRYDIARNLEKHSERKTFEEMAGDDFWMDHLEFPASYALYRNRK